MYPLERMMKEMVLQRNAPRIGLLEVHRSSHRCWPWDLDPWMELNNGRTLTLYDLGRLPMMLRNGLVESRQSSYSGTLLKAFRATLPYCRIGCRGGLNLKRPDHGHRLLAEVSSNS